MSENKTKETAQSPLDFIHFLENERRKNDALVLLELMSKITNKPGKMWGSSLVGFGYYHYQYESGREGDFFLTGFSPRKQNLAVYIMPGFSQYGDLLEQLGKHKLGKSCLYINKLKDIDLEILKVLIEASVKDMKTKYHAE